MISSSHDVRLVLAGGGTAGHVYPALAAVQALRQVAGCTAQIRFLGSSRANEREIVERDGIPFVPICSRALRGKGPVGVARSLADLAIGIRQARTELRAFRPAAVFATGGYASVPVGLAARSLHIPLLVYLPDVRPGWAVRFLSRLARIVAVSTDGALASLPTEKTVVTGYPVRREFFTVSRDEARTRLNVSEDLPAVLIMGGSLGAHRLNLAVLDGLEQLLAIAQVIHITGLADEDWIRQNVARQSLALHHRYHVYGYLHELPLAMLAADLGITRAGASTLGELPAAALPAILVPLELADQALNAQYLQSHRGAVVLTHKELGRLVETVHALLSDPWRLEEMRAAMRTLARPDAAQVLAQLILQTIDASVAKVA